MEGWKRQRQGLLPGHLLPRIAELLGVSVETVLGVGRAKEPTAPRHSRKLRDIEKLSEADRKAVLKFIDALLVRQRIEGRRVRAQ